MENRSLRLAVVGCGAIFEKNHLSAVTGISDWEISFLVDNDIQLLQKYAGQLNCKYSNSIKDIPADIDVCLVATPNFLHAEQSIFLLEKGHHVVCEKPVTISLNDAERVRDAVIKTSKHFFIVHPRRFQKNLDFFKTSYLPNIHIKNIDVALGYKFNWQSKTNFYDFPEKAGGGVFLDLGVHVLDALLSLWNGPIEINNIIFGAAVQTNPVIDSVSTCFGSIANIPFTIKTSRHAVLQNSMKIVTDESEILLSLSGSNEISIKSHIANTSKKIDLQIDKAEDTFVTFWHNLACFFNGKEFNRNVKLATIEDGITVMECIEKARKIGQFIKI
ncbi:Gfo/Idh/MocA family oxidoreductase [Ferruginibacter albus]|uniref:Gfo/Idh/MocA family oxidoreductase n=1 Tax=Ferruginibacter albus TaxID=2875540 RepID=UPI001CC6CBB5|nr:Gfo/Idh/MocA family oxidoreductase [Ferruginibacter albus]UAY50683.1 Gfo/Idh/MocA family oxidoreductase [Ferruginibacter albus]